MRFSILFSLLFLSACVGVLPPDNKPDATVGDRSGYRVSDLNTSAGDVQLLLSFSGGGIRAASLSYGVLKEMAAIRDGGGKPLLDEVDYISAVSGGSFTAAYYGLYGEDIFEHYERDFLKKSVQSALLKKIVSPGYWYSAVFSGLNRTEMAADYYDKTIFRGSTFHDILKRGKPFIEINTTELSNGNRFAFTQEFFDLICSDLADYPVAKAVTASSAVPVLFPPVPLRNHAHRCNYDDFPYLYDDSRFEQLDERQKDLVRRVRVYRDSKTNPYLHLVDGGIADNLGVHALLDRMTFSTAESFAGHTSPAHILIVVVNAEVHPGNGINQSYQPPSMTRTVSAITDTMMNRYSFESRNQIEARVAALQQQLVASGSDTRLYLVHVDFESFKQQSIKRYFNNLPTSLELDDNEIDNLVLAGQTLLRVSPAFGEFLQHSGYQRPDAEADGCDEYDCEDMYLPKGESGVVAE